MTLMAPLSKPFKQYRLTQQVWNIDNREYENKDRLFWSQKTLQELQQELHIEKARLRKILTTSSTYNVQTSDVSERNRLNAFISSKAKLSSKFKQFLRDKITRLSEKIKSDGPAKNDSVFILDNQKTALKLKYITDNNVILSVVPDA